MTLFFFLMLSIVWGQPVVNLGTTKTVKPGDPVTLTVTYTSGGQSTAAMQWKMTQTGGALTNLTAAVGTAATAAGKQIQCKSVSITPCLVYGINTTNISDGVVATITGTVPLGQTSDIVVTLNAGIAATPNGSGALLDTVGTVTIKPQRPVEDITGDWKVTIADVTQASANALASDLGTGGPSGDPTGDGIWDVRDILRVISACQTVGGVLCAN